MSAATGLLLTLVGLSPPGAAAASEPAPTYDEPEAYEVYAAILPSANADQLVIRIEIGHYRMCLRPDPEYDAVLGPAMADYLTQNAQRWSLQSRLPIGKPYEMIRASDLDSLFARRPGGWKAFCDRYPDSQGWIELSAVGFNADKTVAVVYMGRHCGTLCGQGGFHVLQKRDGKWVYLEWEGVACSWVS